MRRFLRVIQKSTKRVLPERDISHFKGWWELCRRAARRGGYLIRAICVIQTKKRVQSTLDGKKACKEYKLLGIIARSKTEIDSYVWSKSYQKAPKWIEEVRKIKNSLDNRMKHDDFFK